jgi:hypothetical protein
LFTAHGALLGEYGDKTPDDVPAGEYSPIYPEFSQRNLTSLLWELQELRRAYNKKLSLDSCVNPSRELATIWNDETEMQEPKVEGKHDSVWRFREVPAEDKFAKAIQLIGANLSLAGNP